MNIISWYNQNRTKVWVYIIAAIVVLLLLWRFSYTINNNKIEIQETNIPYKNEDNLNSIVLSSEKSAITGSSYSINKEKITVIDSFISYCNSANIQAAYNLLSNECKEEMYNDLKSFEVTYYKPIFSKGNRNVNIENWFGDTYKVDYTEDYLSMGRYSESNNIRDYITIVTDSDNNSKLNINKYIGRTELDKIGKTGDLEVKVTRKDSYMDYEKYTFVLKNGYNHKVLIGKIEDDENVSYLVDKNNIKYNAIVSKLSEADLLLYEKQTKTIQINYYNQYSSTRRINRVEFPRIYLNYQAYLNNQNNNIYSEYGSIQIEV